MSHLDGSLGIRSVQSDSSDPVPVRDTFHFVGLVTVEDDADNGETIVTFTQSEDAPAPVTLPTWSEDQEEIAHDDLDLANLLRMSTTTAVNVYGMTPPTSSGVFRKTLVLISGEHIVIKNQSTTETTAAGRFVCPFDLDYELAVNSSIDVVYDAVAQRWRLIP